MDPRDPDAEEVERLAEKYAERLRRGEAPDIDEYVSAHPHLEASIRHVLKAIGLMEGVKPSNRELRSTGAARQSLDTEDPVSVDNYEVVRRIGRGGMGRVFEAKAPDATRVALKLIHPHLLQEEGYVARFLQEARLGERVSHPGVVRTLDSGTYHSPAGEAPYLVLEYVEGQDLKGLLTEVEVVPERLARHIGVCVADALTAVHEAGIVHRDLKPENVIITAEEDVKLMDMGVGLLLEQEQRLSRTGQFVGSLLYAAPEQLSGERPDGRTDLYALGLLLYELVTGALPRRGGLVKGAEPIAAGAVTGAGPFFQSVLRTLLQTEPADRFESAAALATVLREGESSAWWQTHRERLGPRPTQGRRSTKPFHGRVDELDALDEAWADVRSGRGRCVWIEGEAGMGKSRLLARWLENRSDTGVAVDPIIVRHEPGEQGVATTPMATAILERLGTPDVSAAMASLLRETPFLAAPMARFLRGAIDDTSTAQLPSAAIGACYVAILRSFTAEEPLILLIEDLHFAPEQIHSLFVYLAKNLEDEGILLIGSTRPGGASRAAEAVKRLEGASFLTLRGLSHAEGEDLFVSASGRPEWGRIAMQVTTKAEGNPLFLLEFARTLRASSRSITGEVEIPSSIRSLFEARLDAVGPEDRELMEVAACYGAEFDPRIVARAAGLGEVAALKAMARIGRYHGVIHTEGANYRFDHHLLQETLYEQTHAALRANYHARLAESAEASHGDTPPERLPGPDAVQLSRQWLLGARPEAAAPYLKRGIEFLRARGESPRVLDLLELAVAHESVFETNLRAYVNMLMAAFSLQRAPHEEVRARMQTALARHEEADDPQLHAEMLGILGKSEEFLGLYDDANRNFQASLAIHERVGNPRGCAAGNAQLARICMLEGRREEAVGLLHRALGFAKELNDPAVEWHSHSGLAAAYMQLDRYDDAHEQAQAMVDCGKAARDAPSETIGRSALSRILLRRGRYREALDISLAVERAHREVGLQRNRIVASLTLIDAWLELGELDNARSRINDALRIGAAIGERDLLSVVQALDAQEHLARGNLTQAHDAVTAAEASAVGVTMPLWRYRSWVARYEVDMAIGRHADAAARLAQAEKDIGNLVDAYGRSQMLAARAALALEEDAPEAAARDLDEGLALYAETGVETGRGMLLVSRALAATRLGEKDEASERLREAADWARETETISVLALSHAYLGRSATQDILAAKVLLERDGARITALARMASYFALWEATWSLPFLKEARRILAELEARARPEDREALLQNVRLHRAIHEAQP